MSSDKIELKCTRLLRILGDDLQEEAKNPVEQHVGRLAKRRARSISQMLIFAIDPFSDDRTAQMAAFMHQGEQRQERLEHYLQSLEEEFVNILEIQHPAPNSDQDSSVDSGDEVANLPKVEQLKGFVLASRALVTFRTRLQIFISPGPIRVDSSGAKEIEARVSNFEIQLRAMLRHLIGRRAISTLVKNSFRVIRPKVPYGHKRISWICVSQRLSMSCD